MGARDKAKNAAFYFNFKKERENQTKNQTAFADGASDIGLQEVIKMLKAEGLEKIFARQGQMARAMREGMQAAGLLPLVSQRVAQRCLDRRVGAGRRRWTGHLQKLKSAVRHYGGRRTGSLERQDFPVVQYGLRRPFDVITAMAATEMVLKGLGHPVKLGSGVAKAQELLMVK